MSDTINILLLAPLKAGSGNLTTAIRIRNYFNDSQQYHCWMKDVNALESHHEFLHLLRERNINVVIAIHALHSGSILTGDKFRSHEIPSVNAKSLFIEKSYNFGDQLAKRCPEKVTSVLSKNIYRSRQLNLNRSIENVGKIVEHLQETSPSVTSVPKLLHTVRCRKRLRSFPPSEYNNISQLLTTRRRKRSASQSTIRMECASRCNLSSSINADNGCLCFSEYTDTLTHIPYALVCAGTDINEFSKHPLTLLTMSRAIYRAKAVISFSRPLLKKVAMIWPNLGSSKLLEIPQAVTTFPSKRHLAIMLQPFGISKDAVVFTIVAGIRPVKDPLCLVKAFSDWHQRTNHAVYLVIIGPMVEKEYGAQFTKIVNESEGIVYLGGLSLSDTHAAIRDSFALVNSSISEGMSTAILEAMSLGIPVIAKDNLGNRALIQNMVDGLIYTDDKHFVNMAEMLMNDANLYKLISGNAKQKIEERHHCSQERQAYFSLVNKLLTPHTYNAQPIVMAENNTTTLGIVV